MPLELGIAVGLRYQSDVLHQGSSPARQHNWVALVPENFVHHQYISDLAGYEAPEHDQTPSKVITKVAAWLSIQHDFEPPSPPARAILQSYGEFSQLLERAKDRELGSLTWPAIVKNSEIIVAAMG